MPDRHHRHHLPHLTALCLMRALVNLPAYIRKMHHGQGGDRCSSLAFAAWLGRPMLAGLGLRSVAAGDRHGGRRPRRRDAQAHRRQDRQADRRQGPDVAARLARRRSVAPGRRGQARAVGACRRRQDGRAQIWRATPGPARSCSGSGLRGRRREPPLAPGGAGRQGPRPRLFLLRQPGLRRRALGAREGGAGEAARRVGLLCLSHRARRSM